MGKKILPVPKEPVATDSVWGRKSNVLNGVTLDISTRSRQASTPNVDDQHKLEYMFLLRFQE